jgi:hypothetical protein
MMNIRKTIISLLTLVLLNFTLIEVQAAPLIENGDFEKGLSKWDYSENVKAKGSWASVDPTGKRQGVLSPFGFMPSELSQSFALAADEMLSLSFDYNLWSCSRCGGGIGDDFVVSLVSDDESYFEEILRVNFTDTPGSGATVEGWTTFENTWDFDSAMALTLNFELDNFKAPEQYGIAFVDNVEVASLTSSTTPPLNTPIPASLLLMGSGVIGSVGLRKYLS